MIKSFTVESKNNNMRIDRLLRTKIGKIPQGLIEKSLRNGKIRLNKKKVKSSHKFLLMTKSNSLTLNLKRK